MEKIVHLGVEAAPVHLINDLLRDPGFEHRLGLIDHLPGNGPDPSWPAKSLVDFPEGGRPKRFWEQCLDDGGEVRQVVCSILLLDGDRFDRFPALERRLELVNALADYALPATATFLAIVHSNRTSVRDRFVPDLKALVTARRGVLVQNAVIVMQNPENGEFNVTNTRIADHLECQRTRDWNRYVAIL